MIFAVKDTVFHIARCICRPNFFLTLNMLSAITTRGHQSELYSALRRKQLEVPIVRA
jgi:hypothetical protein